MALWTPFSIPDSARRLTTLTYSLVDRHGPAPLKEDEAVTKLAKTNVPRGQMSSAESVLSVGSVGLARERQVGPGPSAQRLGAVARGPSFSVSARATTSGTMLRMSPRNRATSLMPDERNTKYF